MNSNDVTTTVSIETLIGLIQMDLDACKGYEQAIRRAADEDLKEQLRQFHEEHKLHIEKLTKTLRTIGGKFPSYDPSCKGFYPNTLQTLQRMRCDDEIMAAVFLGERVTNRTYSDALDRELLIGVRGVIEECYRDEKRHLELTCRVPAMPGSVVREESF